MVTIKHNREGVPPVGKLVARQTCIKITEVVQFTDINATGCGETRSST
jgi:hypothetical protein